MHSLDVLGWTSFFDEQVTDTERASAHLHRLKLVGISEKKERTRGERSTCGTD